VLNIILGLVLALLVSIISLKLKYITFGGAVTVFFLASVIFSFGELKWSVPILAFFIPSSILSRVKSPVSVELRNKFEKSSVRDSLQVLANGGIGGILVLLNYFYPDKIWYLVYLSFLGTVSADTWGTEIGTLTKRKTYNILTLRKCEQGTSGGISIAGTIGAFLGSFIVVLFSFPWLNTYPVLLIFVLIILGFSGSLFDSILGATIQAKYKCSKCGEISERKHHCGIPTALFSGFKWMNNDLVNFSSGIISSIFLVIILGIWN